MNLVSKPSSPFAQTRAWASLRLLAVAGAAGLALLAQTAAATTYDVFPTNGVAKPYWPSAVQWQVIPGLETSALATGWTLQNARADFIGNATYPTAYYAADASYVYFRVRINTNDAPYTPLTPNTGASGQWAHNISILIDKNADNIPDYAFAWDTAGNGSGVDHQLELNVPPIPANTSATLWSAVNMADRDGTPSSKLHPDFNTIAGHTDDGYLRLVGNQAGPNGANTATYVEFAVKWAFLTGTDPADSTAISSLAPGQTWRVQFASMLNNNDQHAVDGDVAGSIGTYLTNTLSNSGSWSGSITPNNGTYTWTGAAGGSDYNWGTGANWDAGTAPVNGCDVIFPPSAPLAPNNNQSGLTLHSVLFTGAGYTVSGYAVSLSGGLTNSSGGLNAFNCNVTLTAAQTYEFNANTTFIGTLDNGGYALTVNSSASGIVCGEFQNIVSGAGGLTKTGAGTLKMFGVINTYTGKTLVTGGTLFIDRESSLGGNPSSFAADQLKLDGGTLQVNNNANLGQNNGNSGLTLGAGGGTFITDPLVEFDVRTVITGSGTLTKTGTGTMKLVTAANTYTGKTIISQGILSANNENRLGSNPGSFTADLLTINGGTFDAAGTFSFNNNRGITLGASGGTISVIADSVLTMSKAITGSGSLTKTVGGTLKLAVANTYTGKTIVSAGILSADGEDRFGSNPGSATADQLTIASGATLNAFGSFTIDDSNRGITLSSGTATVSVDAGMTLQVANVIAGSGGALTKTGTGILTLTGINTYSGATTVSDGKLIGVTGASCANSAVTVSTTTATNSVSITDNTKQWTCAGLAYSAAGVADFNFGSVVPSTTLAPLQINGNMDFTATPTVTIEAATLPSGTGVYPLIHWTGTTSGAKPTIWLNKPARINATLTSDANNLYLNVTGNTLPLVWNVGSETWDIAAANWKDSAPTPAIDQIYSEGDSVRFDDTTAAGNGQYTVTIQQFTDPDYSSLTVNPASVTVDNSSVNYTIAAVTGGGIGGATGLTKSGSGTLTLSSVNTYTGITTINAGTVSINSDTRLGSVPGSATPGKIILNGGTLLASGTFTLNANRGVAVGPNAGSGSGTINVASGKTNTYGGIIADNGSGTGSFTKSGVGTLVLSGASTYSGSTTVGAGRLVVDGSTAASSSVTVAAGAILAGVGSVNGSVVVNGTIAAANTNLVGSLSTGSESWNSGGTNIVEINNATGTAGTGWDLLNIAGSLTVDADSGSKFTIKVVSLSGSAAGSAANFDNTQNYTWRIATASGGVTGFDASKLSVDTSSFANAQGTGHFIITQSGNDINLQFVHVTADPLIVYRAWGTYLRIPVADVLAKTAGGTGERTLYSVTSRDGDYVLISGTNILFAPAGNANRILDYTVHDSTSPTPYSASSIITVTVTNAVGLLKYIEFAQDKPTLTFSGVPGFNYLVERTTSMSEPITWIPMDGGTNGTTDSRHTVPTGGSAIIWTFTDQNPPTGQGYYRLRQNN